jgi:hypothetical protein
MESRRVKYLYVFTEGKPLVHVGQVQVIRPGVVVTIGDKGEEGDRRAVDRGVESVGVKV